jgi:hypothetical protein
MERRTKARDAFFSSNFLWVANKPKDFAPAMCIPWTTTSDNANYQSCFWSHGEAGTPRPKTQTCPARRPISLASAYLVRVAQGLQCSWVEYQNFYSK